MDFAIELAKGTLQYAPSYIAIVIEFLTGPLQFFKTVLATTQKEEELKKAFSFTFLTILMLALLSIFMIETNKFVLLLITELTIKIIQVSLTVASAHLALRAVAVVADRSSLTAFTLYLISFAYLGISLVVFSLAGSDLSKLAIVLVCAVFVIIPIFIIAWSAIYSILRLSLLKSILSFILFCVMYMAVGLVVYPIIQRVARSSMLIPA